MTVDGFFVKAINPQKQRKTGEKTLEERCQQDFGTHKVDRQEVNDVLV